MLKEDGNQRCQTEIQFQFRIIQKFLRENGYSLDLPRGNSDDALGFGTFSKVYRGKRIKKNCKKCAIKGTLCFYTSRTFRHWSRVRFKQS